MPAARMRRLAGLAAAALLLLTAAAEAVPRDPAEAGLEAFDAGDFATARRLLEQATALEPDDPLLHYGLGVSALQLGDDVVAVRALERAAELDDAFPGVQAELGITLYRLGDLDRAEVHLVEALVQGPEDAEVLLHLGLLDAAGGEPERAIRLFEEAALVEPSLAASAWYEAAGVRLDQDDLDAAIETLERAAAAEGPESARLGAAELIASLRGRAPRRVELSAGAGIEYDDNLTVPDADVATGVDDVAAIFDAGIDLYAVRRTDVQLSVGYDFYQSLYRTVTGLDLQSHSPFVRLTAGDGSVLGSVSYRYTNDSLGGAGFMSTHRGDVGAEWAVAPWLFGLVGTRFEDLSFDQTRRRDAQRVSLLFGGRVTHPSAPVSLELTWRPVWTDARGPEFDYRADLMTTRLYFGVSVPNRTIHFRLDYDWESRDYENPTRRIRARRRDDRHTFGAGSSVVLIGPTEVSLGYLHISSSSNLPELNYVENIVTLRLGVYY